MCFHLIFWLQRPWNTFFLPVVPWICYLKQDTWLVFLIPVRPAGDLQWVSKTKADDRLCWSDIYFVSHNFWSDLVDEIKCSALHQKRNNRAADCKFNELWTIFTILFINEMFQLQKEWKREHVCTKCVDSCCDYVIISWVSLQGVEWIQQAAAVWLCGDISSCFCGHLLFTGRWFLWWQNQMFLKETCG